EVEGRSKDELRSRLRAMQFTTVFDLGGRILPGACRGFQLADSSARAWHDPQSVDSFKSIHSTACEGAMAQEKSSQCVRSNVCPTLCTASLIRRSARISGSWGSP